MGTLLRLTWETWKATSPAKELAEAGNSLHAHLRRDVTPAVCYNDCDGAYKIGLSMGKNDTLCASDGSFFKVYYRCRSCIEANEDSVKHSESDYVEPQLDEFLKFCDGKNVSATACDDCTTSLITDWEGSIVTVVMGPNSVAATQSLSMRTITITHGSTPTSIPGPSSDELNKSSGPDIATIVGPVVPSVVLLLVLAVLGFWWHRRRQLSKTGVAQVEEGEGEAKVDKAQLHSDCVARPTFELEGSMPVVLDLTARKEGEMPANEVAAHEKPAEGDPKGQTSQEENSRDVQEGTVDNPGSSK